MAGTETTTAAGQELPPAFRPDGPVALALRRPATATDPAKAADLKKTLLQQLGFIRYTYGIQSPSHMTQTPAQRFYDALRDHMNPHDAVLTLVLADQGGLTDRKPWWADA